ncbi:MAG: hypothetical protein KGJ34_02395 [Patescibacteria group bacterium]|nr:hypothetical protein [Patescibacteria group bacterium]
MPLTLGLAMLVSAALGSTTPALTTPAPAPVLPEAQTVKQYVTAYFSDIPIMVDIARCESHFHQFGSDGEVYRGEINHEDLGVMQINDYYHGAEAKNLNLDLASIEGNVAFARYLYEKQGTTPWDSSKECWGPSQNGSSEQLAINR